MSDLIMSKLKEWRQYPLQFAHEVLGVVPSSQQEEALKAFSQTDRITIRSGHGTGKDAFASWAIINFMVTRPYAKVICTAPTARQLKDVLWSELSKWLRQSLVANEFEIQKDKIYQKQAKDEWWIRAVSPSVRAAAEEQAETLAGFHGDHMLIVIDEASGVPDPVFIPLEGAMTQEDNRCLMIGNMTKNTGYFYESHYHAGICDAWTKFHWDSRKSTNVSPKMVDYFRMKYGEDSNIFRIRVAGEPPLSDDTTLIPLHWAQQCVGNDIVAMDYDPFYLGVDVARYGDDDSVILPRQGNIIMPWESFNGMNTIDVGGHVLLTYNELEASGIAVDEIGVGAGLTDWLMKKLPRNVFGINVATSSSDIMRYHRLRDELWWKVREKCANAQYSFPFGKLGEELCNELASAKYEFDANNAVKVESKKDMKARGVKSPNIADALCVSEHFYNIANAVFNRPKSKKKRRKATAHYGRNGWQAA